RDLLMAETVRQLLALNRPSEAAQAVTDYGRGRRLPGELRFVMLEALFARWEKALAAGETSLAEQLRRMMQEHVVQAERELGGFWAYRCRALLERGDTTRRYGPELAGLVRRAETLYAAQRYDEALQTYAEAVRRAEQIRRSDVAAELAFTQASVLYRLGRFRAAADAFTKIAENHPDTPKVAEAHLLAAYCLGRVYEKQPTPAHRQAYLDALSRHLARYADHPTAAEAAWMMGRLQESLRRFQEALAAYRSIPRDHPRRDWAEVAVARCHEKRLAELRRRGEDVTGYEADVLAELARFENDRQDSDGPLSLPRAELLVRTARIELNRSLPDYAQADRLLDRVFDGFARRPRDASAEAQSVESAWNNLIDVARQLRIVSLAGQERLEEAQRLVEDLSRAGDNEILN
ncbi:MAG: hypothetical protein D6760_12575, partial [Deltaproteobacteria bacterium]